MKNSFSAKCRDGGPLASFKVKMPLSGFNQILTSLIWSDQIPSSLIWSNFCFSRRPYPISHSLKPLRNPGPTQECFVASYTPQLLSFLFSTIITSCPYFSAKFLSSRHVSHQNFTSLCYKTKIKCIFLHRIIQKIIIGCSQNTSKTTSYEWDRFIQCESLALQSIGEDQTL